ncbi:hypothetical protein ACHAXR_002303 [Thalassiosira sp. AJA248-18]
MNSQRYCQRGKHSTSSTMNPEGAKKRKRDGHFTVAILVLVFWGAESAFVARQRKPECKHATQPLGQCSYASSDIGLFAAPKDKIMSTNKRRRPRLSQKNPLPDPTRERTVVIMYHKPPNVITSHSNADELSQSAKALQHDGPARRRTVYEDIYSMKGFISDRPVGANKSFDELTKIQTKLHAIGRLDADTTGLLLLTNDGALVHRITNPNAKSDDGLSTMPKTNPVQKTYEAVIMGYHSFPKSAQQSSVCNSTLTSNNTSNDDSPLQELLEKGVALSPKHGGQTKPVDALSILSHPSRSTTRVSITISEGKNRQIRRMFHAIGSGVMKLHRVSVGTLTMDGVSHTKEISTGQISSSGESDASDKGLKEGEWRLLTEDEIEKGLGWKCRYLDEVSSNARKVDGGVNGRRRSHKQRRKRL